MRKKSLVTIGVRLHKDVVKQLNRDLKMYKAITGKRYYKATLFRDGIDEFHDKIERMLNKERDPLMND